MRALSEKVFKPSVYKAKKDILDKMNRDSSVKACIRTLTYCYTERRMGTLSSKNTKVLLELGFLEERIIKNGHKHKIIYLRRTKDGEMWLRDAQREGLA